MTSNLIEMTEDEFDAQYKLLKNHLNPNASWAIGDSSGCLFETFGEELDFVRRQDPATVWTVFDGEDGDLYIVSGFHFVNRIGYRVSIVARPDGVDVEVRIPMQTEPDDESAVFPPAEPAPATKPNPLLVPKGTSLVPGKMYLRLYHGRTDPAQEMDGWGFDGPTVGPLSSYVHTYCCHFRIHGERDTSELWLEKHDDMIRWDGCFYGDMEVFVANANQKA
jgi:hypothetical protein